MNQGDPILKKLLVEYHELAADYIVMKKKADDFETQRGEIAHNHLEKSKEILEYIGMDTNSFKGGLYNFTDAILEFLNSVAEGKQFSKN